MSDALSFLPFFFGDVVVFSVLQLLLLFIFSYAGIRGRRTVRDAFKNISGKPSHFVLAYGIISASLIQAISAADMLVGFKLIVTIADLWVIFYLCFSNVWFRGIVIEVITKTQNKGSNRYEA